MAVELAIIIVNWNGGELLRRAVESVLAAPPRMSYEIIVVDNASTDDSLDWLRTCGLAQLRLIENTENVGFGRANNQGFAATDAPLLFLLNNDAEVHAGAIDTLVATIKSDARIGMCGPRLINPDGSLQTSVWRNPVTGWELLVTSFGLARLLPRRLRGELLLADYWAHNRRRRVNMLKGAALLVKRELVDAIGGFDERFHMYGEDNEWCLRTVRAGWWVLFEPAAVVLHHGGQSTSKRWTSAEDLQVRFDSYFNFQRHCLSWRQALTIELSWCFLLPCQRVFRKLRGRAADDVKLAWQVHSRELKRLLWRA
jgi:GT2 family glycosyltransferase